MLKKIINNNNTKGHMLLETIVVLGILGVIAPVCNDLFFMYSQNINNKEKINVSMQENNNIELVKSIMAEGKVLSINNDSNTITVNSTYFNPSGESFTLSCKNDKLIGQRNEKEANTFVSNCSKCSIKGLNKYQEVTNDKDKIVMTKVDFTQNDKKNLYYMKLK